MSCLPFHRALCNDRRMTDLVSATELAEALGVDRSTIHRRIARGELQPAAKVAGRPVFLAADVENLKRGERHLIERKA